MHNKGGGGGDDILAEVYNIITPIDINNNDQIVSN